jgi:hypothetical protein
MLSGRSLPTVVAAILFASSSNAASTNISSAKAAHKAAINLACASVAQGLVNGHPLFLAADAPPGVSPAATSVRLFARPAAPSRPWVECQPNTTCNGVVFPPVGSPGADYDGSPHYSILVKPFQSGRFSQVTQVRLMVLFPQNGKRCTAQQSFEVAATAVGEMALLTPPGVTILTFRTYAKVLLPGQTYQLCDAWLGMPKPWIVNACLPSKRVGFQLVQQKESDRSEGWLNKCGNSSSDRRGCRVQIDYVP